jgi:hypothetical protein
MDNSALLFLLFGLLAHRALDAWAAKVKCEQALARANQIPGGFQTFLVAQSEAWRRTQLRIQHQVLTLVQREYITILMLGLVVVLAVVGLVIDIGEPTLVLAIVTLVVSIIISAFNLINDSFRWARKVGYGILWL